MAPKSGLSAVNDDRVVRASRLRLLADQAELNQVTKVRPGLSGYASPAGRPTDSITGGAKRLFVAPSCFSATAWRSLASSEDSALTIVTKAG